MGVIRYGTDQIVALLDSTIAGRNVAEWLPGHDIPAVATLAEALALEPRPDALLIGIAPTGGRLPPAWRTTILEAIDAGLDVHSGLHTFIGDDPEFAAAAGRAGTAIVDYRRPPERMETAVGRLHRARHAGHPDRRHRLRHRQDVRRARVAQVAPSQPVARPSSSRPARPG